MAAGRVLYAGLRLLDRQLVDRNGRLCGKVDDLELDVGEDGRTYVTAIITGPGALLLRTGHTRLGGWLQRLVHDVAAEPVEHSHIPIGRVSDIGNHVTVSLDSEEVATFAVERWVRDHVIGRIPGSRNRADQ